MSKPPLLLFTKEELPLSNKEAQERVETQLLLFVIFLCRLSLSSTLYSARPSAAM
jgi:hypothetical protein